MNDRAPLDSESTTGIADLLALFDFDIPRPGREESWLRDHIADRLRFHGYRVDKEWRAHGYRVDILALTPSGQFALIEVKIRRPELGIGQLLHYQSLLVTDCLLVLAVPEELAKESLRRSCEAAGISLWPVRHRCVPEAAVRRLGDWSGWWRMLAAEEALANAARMEKGAA